MSNPLRLFVLLLVISAFAACGGGERVDSSTARVEELLESGPAVLPLELAHWEGERDGAMSRATFHFGGRSAELHLDLHIAYDPQPTLAEGNWTYRGPTGTGEGPVRAESVRFVGGQGEGISVGGVYLLLEAGHSRFRVSLPLTAIAPAWNPRSD
jgi:hypothetical protein